MSFLLWMLAAAAAAAVGDIDRFKAFAAVEEAQEAETEAVMKIRVFIWLFFVGKKKRKFFLPRRSLSNA